MNTYYKFYPNVFLAKCTESHQKGDIIEINTKYDAAHECSVHNLMGNKEGFYFYSITRIDGTNEKTKAIRKAEKHKNWAISAEKKSNDYYEASKEGKEFLVLAQPILEGHHSEKRHRALIERNKYRFKRMIEFDNVASNHVDKSKYWESKKDTINLSMPESIEYFEYELEKEQSRNNGLKDGSIKRDHDYSLTYSNKKVKELKEKLALAQKLWGQEND